LITVPAVSVQGHTPKDWRRENRIEIDSGEKPATATEWNCCGAPRGQRGALLGDEVNPLMQVTILNSRKGARVILTILHHRAPEAPIRAQSAIQVAASPLASYDGPKSQQHKHAEQDRKCQRNFDAMVTQLFASRDKCVARRKMLEVRNVNCMETSHSVLQRSRLKNHFSFLHPTMRGARQGPSSQ